MKRRALALLALLSFAAVAAADQVPDSVIAINTFGGLNTDDSPISLQNQTPDAENVVSDDGPGLKGRFGFVSFSTEPATSMWEFPVSNGTRYLVRANRTTGTLKATSGDGVFNILISTIPTDRDVAATPLGDKFFFTNTLDGIKYWNTSTVTVVSTSLTFDKLVNFKGRLVGAGVAANQRVLYFSKYLDGTNFTLATVPTDDDPTQITVAGALDENITALYSSFQDKLVWFKTHSFGAIYGSRRSNFTQRTFSDVTGTGTPESVRDCVDKLRWLGPDRKIWEFDGTTFYKITEDIDNLMITVAQGDSNSRNATQTSQADWQNGTQAPTNFLDLTSSLGNALPATISTGDDAQGDFLSGTCNSVSGSCDTSLSSGSISAKISTIAVTAATDWGGGTFDNTLYVDTQTAPGTLLTVFPETCELVRDGSNGSRQVWATQGYGTVTPSAPSGACIYTSTQTQFVRFVSPVQIPTAGVTFYFQLNNVAVGGGGAETYFGITDRLFDVTDPFERPFSLSSAGKSADHYFWINFLSSGSTSGIEANQAEYKNAGDASNSIITPHLTASNGVDNSTAGAAHGALPSNCTLFLKSGSYAIYFNGVLLSSGTHTFSTAGSFYVYFQAAPNISGSTAFTFDNFTIAPETFTYTSAGQDTGLTTGAINWGNLSGTYSGTGSVNFQTRTSADNVTFDAGVAVTTGAAITSARKRYLEFVATLTYPSTGTIPGTPTALQDIGAVSYETMSFTSRGFDTTELPPVWGLFTISTAAVGSGGATSWQTQSSDDNSSWTAAAAITAGAQPTSAVKRYWRYVISSTPTATGGYDRIDSVSLATKSTGTLTNLTVDLGSALSSYGPIVINDTTNGGTITYQYSTASTPGGVGGSWTTFTKGATPTGTVNRYVAVRAIYSMTVATQAPTLSDITFSWTEGSTIKTASVYFNNRYWLSVAISSAANNRILIYDKKKQWQRYSGLNADALVLYNSKLYFANSTGIFQAENGYSDNGTSITSYYRTPTFAPNKLDLYANFDYLYMTTDTSDSTLTTSFQVQGIATDYSLGSVQMNASTGFQNFKLPFGQAEVQTAKYVNFKWQVSGTSFWRIDNGTLYFQPTPLPE